MMADYYSGRVNSVVFENTAQDFYVLRLVLDVKDDDTTSTFASTRSVTVRGNVPGMSLKIGSWFGFEAKWERHPKYGDQLVITKAPVVKGKWTSETAVSMLTAHGVGERVCQRLVDHFGDDLVAVLDSGDEVRLHEAPGLTPFTAAHVSSRWGMVRAYFQTLEFLADAQVPKSRISQVWSHFGDEAKTILSQNPWALVEIDGITFPQADEVALRLGLDMNSPLRIRGAVLFACKNRRGMGHMFLSSGDMLDEVRGLVSHANAKDVAKALGYLHKHEALVIDRDTRPGTTAIYEPWSHYMENECARQVLDRLDTADPFAPMPAIPEGLKPGDKLARALDMTTFTPYTESLSRVGTRAEKKWKGDPDDLNGIAQAALDDWSAGSKIVLSKPQLEGALNALTAPVSILTGLPGTGKTTTLMAVVAVLKDAGVPFLLVAPTGIAAKRMSSMTNAPASTIHRAFKAKGWNTGEERESTYVGIIGGPGAQDSSDGSGEEWEYGEEKPHPARVIICDESSMVDQHLMYRLLHCTSPRARLVFVGDAAQLPSVGPGNVLRDLISTGIFPTVALTEIYRQEETSDIVIAAHATHRGEIPECKAGKGSDFVFIETHDEDAILDILIRLVDKLYAKRKNFQVLSPRHAGTLGVTNLNQRLREILNPKQPGLQEMRLGSEVVREDDRVMVIRNNYDKGIFNGDVGKVARLDRKAREVEIKLHGPPVVHVRLSFKDAPRHLRLAYTVTVHKSQGQEYDTIVLPLVKGFGHQLQRNLFYTAITRAKKQVVLIGHREAMVRAVMNNKEDVRNTLFQDRLLRQLEGGSALSKTGT